MMTKNPLISIILPTYNGKKERLKESVDSVLNQTFKDFELIIINDASTNDIEETILEYTKKDDRIVYIKNEKNLKLTKTLNKWISLANGKYIARIDDDDIWEDEQKLEKQIKFLEENNDYWIIWTNWIIIDQDWNELYKLIRPSSNDEIKKKIIIGNWFIHSSILIRKTTLDEVWWFYNPEWNFVEDYELWLRIWKASKMKIISDSYIKYRQNIKSVSNSNYRKQKWLALKLFFKYYKFYPKKYFIRALIFHIWEWLVPYSITSTILRLMKNINI